MPDELPELLTIEEVAALLRLNQQTIRNWIDAGSFPHIRIGRRVRIRREDFQLFAGSQGADEGDELLTVVEVAALFRLNPQTIHNWIASGSLRAVRVGERRIRIRRADVHALITDAATTRWSKPPAPEKRFTAEDFWDGVQIPI